MMSIYAPVARDLHGRLLRAMVAALCAALACPAFAQEGAPAAGADAPQAATTPSDAAKGGQEGAAPTSHDIDLVAPRRGADGLWRRANVKTLIANASGRAAGLPAVNIRTGSSPSLPRIDAAIPRNAIGVALPGAPSPGRAVAGVTARSTGAGTSAGRVGSPILRMRAPANAGAAMRGAAINGTTMGRMTAAPGSIGGPAKDHSGINGTLMRPRH
jgi:hypothetical protein